MCWEDNPTHWASLLFGVDPATRQDSLVKKLIVGHILSLTAFYGCLDHEVKIHESQKTFITIMPFIFFAKIFGSARMFLTLEQSANFFGNSFLLPVGLNKF